MRIAQFVDRSGPVVGIRGGTRWINYGKAERVMYMLRHGVVTAGIGPIRHGDVVLCRIRGIGELRNPVRWR